MHFFTMFAAVFTSFPVGETDLDLQVDPVDVLVFTRTAGFRHDSIPAARRAMELLGQQRNWRVTLTESSDWFTAEKLRHFDTVVFLLTSGDVLNTAQETDFQAFVENGGGLVGVHSATDTENEWDWYGNAMGTYFVSHPEVQPADIVIEDTKHPTTSFLPNPWRRTDEWYDFRDNPRARVKVLASMDVSSFKGGRMGTDHPIVWWNTAGKGRIWYTGMGHTIESFDEPLFLRQLAEAVEWTAQKELKRSAL